MSKKSKNWVWFWLIVILVVIFFLWIASRVTDNSKVKKYHDRFKDEADELKNQISGQEKIVNRIQTELKRFRTLQEYLITKTTRIYFGIRCAGGVLILGLIFFIHGVMSFSMVEIIGAITTTGGFLYLIVSGIIWNEVKGVNEVLRLFYDTILRMTYNNHQFEPALIEALEFKLEKEIFKHDQMKNRYQEIYI